MPTPISNNAAATRPPSSSSAPSEPRTHRVNPGDTMWGIANQHGVSLDDLVAANPQIRDPGSIAVGDLVNLPGAKDAAPTSAPPAAAPSSATSTAPTQSDAFDGAPAPTAITPLVSMPPAAGPLTLDDGNSMRPGSPAATAPVADLSALEAKGYRTYPISDLSVLNTLAPTNPDADLRQQPVGGEGFDVVANGGFYYHASGQTHAAGAVMRDGVLEHSGVEKAAKRGGIAVLEDGSIVVGRMTGASMGAIQERFGAESPVRDFIGGGALLIEGGEAVSSQDLFDNQKFDQGGNGIHAGQMRSTDHAILGIRDGQAFLISAHGKTGAQIQAELLAAGFDTAIKLDGGSGSYLRDAGGQHMNGQNPFGLGINVR